ncbi:hypothetical protein ACFY97_17330 [Streptomyces klenkii]|uniref:hypothetical protein n=1 Tax=Streptomyces klenkii TaxID=1420899 RepID=UPI0036E76193
MVQHRLQREGIRVRGLVVRHHTDGSRIDGGPVTSRWSNSLMREVVGIRSRPGHPESRAFPRHRRMRESTSSGDGLRRSRLFLRAALCSRLSGSGCSPPVGDHP